MYTVVIWPHTYDNVRMQCTEWQISWYQGCFGQCNAFYEQYTIIVWLYLHIQLLYEYIHRYAYDGSLKVQFSLDVLTHAPP